MIAKPPDKRINGGLFFWPKGNEIIKQLKENEGFSIRQIERATGVLRGIIAEVDK